MKSIYPEMEGRYIRLHPEDSVWKWGLITTAGQEGCLITITYVKSNGIHSNYHVGNIHFLPWGKLTFYFCNSAEANTGKRRQK
jgi:hypothetical protein